MTNQPLDPSVPLDLAQLRAAQAEAKTAPKERKETLRVGRHEFPLVKEFTPNDMMKLDDAQEQGTNKAIFEFVPRLVPKAYRDQLLAYIMDDPDDDDDRIDFVDLMEEINSAVEVIAARP